MLKFVFKLIIIIVKTDTKFNKKMNLKKDASFHLNNFMIISFKSIMTHNKYAHFLTSLFLTKKNTTNIIFTSYTH